MPPRATKRKAGDLDEEAPTRSQPRRNAARTDDDTQTTVQDTQTTQESQESQATTISTISSISVKSAKSAKSTASKASTAKAKTASKKAAPKKAATKTAAKKTAVKKVQSESQQDNAASEEDSQQSRPSKRARSTLSPDDTDPDDTDPKPVLKKAAAPKKAATPKKVKKAAAPKKTKVAKRLPKLTSTPTERLHVFSFGTGEQAELGLGPKAKIVKRPRLNQYLLPDEVGVVNICLGGMHGLALTHDGKVYSWGVNDLGALGRDTTVEEVLKDVDATDSEDEEDVPLNEKESVPGLVEFPDGTVITRIAAGDSVSIAVTDTGKVYGWGTIRCSDGPIGFDANNEKFQPLPHLMPSLKDITDVSIGADHVLCLTKDGNVLAWGNGEQYQLGRRVVERTRKNALLPREFGLPRRKVKKVETGAYHSFAIMNDGKVFAWGLNGFGQCGIWDSPNQADDDNKKFVHTPTLVKSLEKYNIVQIAAGLHHSAALTDEGELLMWGRMDAHQIGLEPTTLPPASVVRDSAQRPRILTVPTPVSDRKFVGVACGSDHNLAIAKEDGSIYSWGFGLMFQTGQGPAGADVILPTRIENTATKDFSMRVVACGGNFSTIGGVPSNNVPSSNVSEGGSSSSGKTVIVATGVGPAKKIAAAETNGVNSIEAPA